MKTFSKKPGIESSRTINCPCCGSLFTNHKKFFSYSSFSYIKCRKCSLVFQNPQPLFEDLSKRYDDEYFRYEIENEKNFLNLMLKGLDDIGFDQLDFSKTGKTVLDIGCATGELLYYMKERGWKTSGVEICSEAAEFGNRERKVNIFSEPLEKNCFSDNSFSFIHASHLIEHLNEPDLFLKEVYRLLKPGGFFAVVTPNIDGFQSSLFKERWRSAIPDHMFLFSKKTLIKMAGNCGFKALKTATWGGLAEGTAPRPVKKAADKLVKLTGSGDVVIVLFIKQEVS
jgi:SAM-dependent methyltransferase